MAKRPASDMKKTTPKERRQEKLIDHYKREARWVTWAAVIMLLLIIFFVGSMGYASNWWQDPTRTSQFSPYAANASAQDSTLPNQTETTSTTDGGQTNTTTRPTTTNSTSTTSQTTTNNTTTTTNSAPTSPVQPSSGLLALIAQTATGENINEVITDAQELGVTYECRTELLVQICDFVDGPYRFTTKNLITGLGITGLSTNF